MDNKDDDEVEARRDTSSELKGDHEARFWEVRGVSGGDGNATTVVLVPSSLLRWRFRNLLNFEGFLAVAVSSVA